MSTRAPPSEDAIKSRILTHMNTDHHDSLSLYLERHHHLSTWRSRKAQLTAMSLDSLTLKTAKPFYSSLGHSRQYTVPISPPLHSWADARPRLVAMDQEARQALGRSEVKLKAFKGPDRGWMYIWVLFLVIVFTSFSQRANFLPESTLYQLMGLHRVPQFAAFCYKVHPLLWAIVIPVHVGEVIVAMVPRLKRYNVKVGIALWWKWICFNAFDGFASLIRFDEMIRSLELEKSRGGGAKEH